MRMLLSLGDSDMSKATDAVNKFGMTAKVLFG